MNTIKEKGRDSITPTAAAIREISVSRVAFQPPPKKRKNAGDGDDAAAAGRLVQSGVLYIYYNARWDVEKKSELSVLKEWRIIQQI